jgi:hypothetical protein
VLAAGSLAVCVAACAVWVRSHRIGDLVAHLSPARADGSRRLIYAGTGAGGIGLGCWEYHGGDLGLSTGWTWKIHADGAAYAGGGWPNESLANRLGFAAVNEKDASGTVMRAVMLPIGLPAAAAAALPSLHALALLRRRARRRAGRCPNCGYDRRAHAPAAPCPECGTPAA